MPAARRFAVGPMSVRERVGVSRILLALAAVALAEIRILA